MQHGIGGCGHAPAPDRARRGMEQREQRGCPTPDVFVRLVCGTPFRLPTDSRVRNGLVRPLCWLLIVSTRRKEFFVAWIQ